MRNREKKAVYDRKYYQQHRVEKARYARKSYQDHKRKRLAHDHNYYREHKKEKLAYAHRYYESNRNEILIKHKEYRETHGKQQIAKGMIQYNVPVGSHCENCGSTENLDRHHPNYDEPLEIVTLCRSCHETLHSKVAELKRQFELLKVKP